MCYDNSSIEKHKGKVSINRLIKSHICLNLSSSLTLYLSLVESPFCGLAFFTCVPTRMMRLVFHLFGENFDFLKKKKRLGVAIYFCFIFEEKNKKEKPWVWLLMEKTGPWKTKFGLGGQVIYWEGMIKTIAPL